MTKKPREDNDFYPTPPDMTRALLNVETFPRVIHEPACGDGAMAHELGNAGYNVVATDLIDRGYGTAPVDFLASEKPAGFRNRILPRPGDESPFQARGRICRARARARL